GVEATVGLDLGEAFAFERRLQLLVDQPNALLELCLLVFLGRCESPLEIVEHGQELLHEPLVGARDQALLVTRDPLAVVLEVGRDALEVVQALVPLRLELSKPLFELTHGIRPGIGRHEVLASSSTTSASSITSSSDSVVSPFPPDAACAWDACAYTASASFCEASWSASVLARISPRSSASSACLSSITRPSIVEASLSSSLSRWSLRLFSVAYASDSAWFFASASSRRRCASSACASASAIIWSTSSGFRPEPPSILICCSFPVPRSLADTLMIPFASMSKVTSISGMPRGAGGLPTSWNLPSVLL